MNACVFFILLLFLSSTEAFNTSCCSTTAKCGHGHGGLNIRFPFRLKPYQSQHCGDQGFDLFCRNNFTMIHFPSYGDLAVKDISYDTRKLNLLDPKNCVHEVFLNLNLSLTPFHYYYALKNYTYINCSASLGPSVSEIPCLSGSQHNVYTVESSVAVPDSCRPIKTVAIPFAYSSYLSDGSLGLGLTWEMPEHEDSGFHPKTGWLNLAQERVVIIAASGLVLLAVVAMLVINMKKILYTSRTLLDSHGDGDKDKDNQFTKELLAGQMIQHISLF